VPGEKKRKKETPWFVKEKSGGERGVRKRKGHFRIRKKRRGKRRGHRQPGKKSTRKGGGGDGEKGKE